MVLPKTFPKVWAAVIMLTIILTKMTTCRCLYMQGVRGWIYFPQTYCKLVRGIREGFWKRHKLKELLLQVRRRTDSNDNKCCIHKAKEKDKILYCILSKIWIEGIMRIIMVYFFKSKLKGSKIYLDVKTETDKDKDKS